MINTLESVSKLSNLPEKNLQKLAKLVMYSICDAVSNDTSGIIEADIGIGKLVLKTDEQTIRYKFIPSSKFEDDLKTTMKTGKSPVEAVLEKGAVDKMLELYRDLL